MAAEESPTPVREPLEEPADEQVSAAKQEPADEQVSAAKQVAAKPAVAPLCLAGRLRRTRAGFVRVLCWITGIALLSWLVRALLFMLGYRANGTLTLSKGGLELRGERRLMGLLVGQSLQLLPLATVQRVRLVGRPGLWAVVCGLVVVLVATGLGITVIYWGAIGRELSWIVLGILVVGLGVGIDALAYLWVRRISRRERAVLEICWAGHRAKLSCVSSSEAEALIAAVGRRIGGEA